MSGARLDSWKEHFNFGLWEESLKKLPFDWTSYLRERDVNEVLPWSNITTGFERLKSFKTGKTDCVNKKTARPEGRLNKQEIDNAFERFKVKYKTEKKLRLRFYKIGGTRFISHLDFIEVLKRSFSMIKLPVSYTQGFNKRERFSAGFPLPVGIESLSELCDVDLYEDLEIEELKK